METESKIFRNCLVALILTVTVISGSSLQKILAQSNSEIQSYLTPEEEREQLERELAEVEKEIAGQQKLISENQAQQSSLRGEINTLNAKANKIALEIRSIDLTLNKINKNITETQRQINNTEEKIDTHKTALQDSLQDVYEIDRQGLMQILLLNEKFSDFYGDLNNITLVQYNLRSALNDITELRRQLVEQKQELASEHQDVSNLKSAQERSKKDVVSIQKQKATILTTTKGKESEYQKILSQTRETAAQIRSRIFKLLGGGELTFQTAYDYAKMAEDATGVRAAFILAILHQESLLGKNVGRCPYFDAAKNKYYMHPTRDVPIFLEITKELGIDPLSTAALVSCPNSDGTYGGAMGPAQFIPSTWKLYEDQISRVTDNNPPSPWRNEDAFVATGLYLKEAISSSACQNYSKQIPSETQILLERCAAARYYSGGNWYTYRFAYGEPVVQKAIKFQADINVLKGGN